MRKERPVESSLGNFWCERDGEGGAKKLHFT
jgi:hypothetical protein